MQVFASYSLVDAKTVFVVRRSVARHEVDDQGRLVLQQSNMVNGFLDLSPVSVFYPFSVFLTSRSLKVYYFFPK